MFKNWFTTVAGIMASMLGVPVAVLSYYATIVKDGPPAWFTHYLQFPMVLIGTIGVVLVGVAAKGADQHSIPAQVQAAGNVASAQTPDQLERAKVQVKQADAQAAPKP